MTIAPERVREALLGAWGRQACRNPSNWPDVLGRLLKDGDCVNPGNTRTSFKPRVETAVTALTEAYSAGLPPDGPGLVWRCFPMLDAAHATALAAELTEAAQVDAAPTSAAAAA